MAPVAGSAYTYAYATLGELLAWIIGWDLDPRIRHELRHRRRRWSKYFNELTSKSCSTGRCPSTCPTTRSPRPGAWFNLPAVLILARGTAILVIGIRESAASNTVLVVVKLGVVLFVIAVGVGYINTANWTEHPRRGAQAARGVAHPGPAPRTHVPEDEKLDGQGRRRRARPRSSRQWPWPPTSSTALPQMPRTPARSENAPDRSPAEGPRAPQAGVLEQKLPATDADKAAVARHPARRPTKRRPTRPTRSVGHAWPRSASTTSSEPVDDSVAQQLHALRPVRASCSAPSLVFFAFIGFDSISTHSEEAIKPQRDVPIGILASLVLCTVLYIAVVGGHHRHAALPDHRHRRGRRLGLPTDGPRPTTATAAQRRPAGLIAVGRPGRHDQRAAHHLPQPGAHLPGHGPRRPAAARHLRRGPRQVPHAAHLDHADRRHHLRRGRLHADPRSWRRWSTSARCSPSSSSAPPC